MQGKVFQAFLDKNADIVIATRPISPKEEKKAVEQGMQLGERLIGYSGLAVTTSPKNSVSDLTMTQLERYSRANTPTGKKLEDQIHR